MVSMTHSYKIKSHYDMDQYYDQVTKIVFDNSGHAPHIEEPEKIPETLLRFC